MNLKALLCMLLTTVCHSVTAVEDSPALAGAPGTSKKAEAQKGVSAFIGERVAAGDTFDPSLAAAVGAAAIDHVVGLAHDLGAFTHKTDTAAAGSDKA